MRAPMVPAPRTATLWMCFMIGLARSAPRLSLRRTATLLGKSIDCPLVFASPNHHYLGFLRPSCFACAGLDRKKGDGKGIPSRLSLSFRAQFHMQHRRRMRRKHPDDPRSCAAWHRRSASTARSRYPGSATPEESGWQLPARRHSSDPRRDLRGSEACGSWWRAKAWSSDQPAPTKLRRMRKPELGRQETSPTAGERVSGAAGAMPVVCFQNSLINYAAERNPLQDTIKVLLTKVLSSLSSRAQSGAALARQEQVEGAYPLHQTDRLHFF